MSRWANEMPTVQPQHLSRLGPLNTFVPPMIDRWQVRWHVGFGDPEQSRSRQHRCGLQRIAHGDWPGAGGDLRRVGNGGVQPTHQELHRYEGAEG